MNRREVLKPLHDVAQAVIRQRLAKFLPEDQRPPEESEAPADESMSEEDMALLTQSLEAKG